MNSLTAAENVLFVVASSDPGILMREVGGSMLRLLDTGGNATVIYGTGSDRANPALEGDLAAIGVGSVWYLEGEPDTELPAVLDALDADAVVVAGIEPGNEPARAVQAAAVRAAAAASIPVYVASHSTDQASGEPTTQIDIRAVRAAKWRALRRLDAEGGTAFATEEAEQLSAVEGFVTLRPAPRTAPLAVEQRASIGSRILSCALAAGVGVAFGALGTIMHNSTWDLGAFSVPWGLILALVAVAALITGLRLILGGRLVASFAAAGVVVAVFVLSLRSPGGSVLVPDGLLGQIWSIAPALIAALVLTWPQAPRPKPASPAAAAAGLHTPEA